MSTLIRRPMTPADAGRWAELLIACEEVDRIGDHYDEADCAEELTDPDIDLAADSLLVLDGERAVAAQVMRLRASETRRVVGDGAVHPDHRGLGLGTELVTALRRRAAQRDAAASLWIDDEVASQVALARGSGMEQVRRWATMRRDLGEPVAPLPLPAGLTPEPLGPVYDPDRWDERLRAANNAAFADHWGSAAMTAQTWRQQETGARHFLPALSVAACDGEGRVGGLVLAFEFAADTARTGVRELHIPTVATVREWRGRGVAGALVAHVLAAGAAAGYARSSLTVDADNPTGALGVYRRAGFAVLRRKTSWSDPTVWSSAPCTTRSWTTEPGRRAGAGPGDPRTDARRAADTGRSEECDRNMNHPE